MSRLINLDKKYKHINWAPKMWQFLHKIKNKTAATTGVYKSKLNEQKGREFSFYLFSKEMVSLIVSIPIFKLTMKWLWFPKADSGLIISARIIVSVWVGRENVDLSWNHRDQVKWIPSGHHFLEVLGK